MGARSGARDGMGEAWRELRRRVADRVAGMGPEETLVLSAQVAGLVDGPGPYVTVGRSRGGWRLEAASNAYLDSGQQLDSAAEERLGELGWSAPTYAPGETGPGSANWWLDLDDPERAAWLVARTLEEVHGVPHPAFLEAGGLDLTGLQGPDAQPAWDVDTLPVVRPADSEHLQRLVDETLTAMLGAPVEHDGDGDVPWPCGDASVAFVQVDAERPVVHVFSFLVVDATVPEVQLAATNLVTGRLPYLSVRMLGERLVAHLELLAQPFVPQHLSSWLARLALEIDEVAAEAASLLGGRRYLEEPASAAEQEVEIDEDLAVVAELLASGTVSPRLVAEVFGDDRGALVRRLVGLRQGRLHVETDDLDGLLHALRSGLRWIVDEPDRFADARRRAGRRVAPRPTVQSLLIDDEPDLFGSDAG